MQKQFTLLSSFTIRVYGILIDEQKRILVADEVQAGKHFTKFPGGGLELGEGTKDCLIREWKEELGQTIDIMKHFYTTDFFQRSAFDESQQVISIYFLVKALDKASVKISDDPIFLKGNQAEAFRWVVKNNFHESLFTFPIDQLVGKMLREIFLKKSASGVTF